MEECVYADEGEGKSDESEDEEGSEKELNEEEEEAADLAGLVAIGGHGDTEDVRSSGYDDVEDVRSCGELPSIGCATKADALAESQTLIGVLETAMSSLKEVGAQGAVVMSRSGGRAAPEKGKGKRTSKGNSKEAHELKSCDTGTLRYKADVPLHARRGARVDIGPHCTNLVERDNLIRSGGSDSD